MKKLNRTLHQKNKTKIKRVVKVSAPKKKVIGEIKITLMEKPRTTHVIMLVDETGSMSAKTKETIAGVNAYFETLRQDSRKNGREYIVSLGSFNSVTGTRFLCRNTPVEEMPSLNPNNYYAQGFTPLYDAIGRTIEECYGDDVTFVIMTDGEENSSKRFNASTVREMIEHKKTKGWQFVFMGCDIDAYAQAGMMGINRGSTISSASQDFAKVMAANAFGTVSLSASNLSGLARSRASFYTDAQKKELDKEDR